MHKPGFFLCILYLILVWPLHAQRNNTLPTYYPVSIKEYNVPEGLPDPCVAMAHIDKEGRLILVSCHHVRVDHNLIIYAFDGRKSWPVHFPVDEDEAGVFFRFTGVTVDGDIYGFYYNNGNWANADITTFFTFNPSTSTMKEVKFGKGQAQTALIDHIALTEEGYYILARHKNTIDCEIYQYTNNKLSLITSFSKPGLVPVEYSYGTTPLVLGVTATDYWIGAPHHTVHRMDRRDKSIRTYSLRVGVNENRKDYPVERIVLTPTGDILFTIADASRYYKWDATTDRMIVRPYLPPGWKPEDLLHVFITRDQAGNMLVAHQRSDFTIEAILEDSEGRIFDYTPVFKDLHLALPLGQLDAYWNSRDLRKELFTTMYNFFSIEVTSNQAIEKFPTLYGTRHIIELSPEELWVKPNGILNIKSGRWPGPPRFDTCFAESDADIFLRDYKRIWSSKLNEIRSYDLETSVLEQYRCPEPVNRFDFLDDDHIIFITLENKVFLLNLKNQVSTLVIEKGIPGYINQVYTSRSGTPWIATSKGLVRVDIKQKKFELINREDGLADDRIIRMYEDKEGKLWLGTFLGGIQVYHPVDKTVKVINEDKGLSNNTIVNILEDDEHFVWVATFNGITIFDQPGTIVGHLYKEDGLIDNESNRWSAFKSRDGLLYFGGIRGVNRINPKVAIKLLKSYDEPKIYLTKLVAGNKDNTDWASLISFSDPQQKNIVKLPAGNRNLDLGFALSNYAAPGKQTFAYKIEGVDEDWNYIGSQNEISINSMPVGRYSIIVTGADHHGKKASNPIIISIHAQQFFYLKWWFYAICMIPVIVLTLLYQYRQRQENKRLESEVVKRTETIQQQADQLREMDAVKTKLYTNITHEFRTPLTIIEGMADDIGKDANAPGLIKRNSRNLLHLVNQMLDLSKLEAGDMPLYLVQSDILILFQYITQSYKNLAASKSIDLHFLTDETSIMMDFDPEKMRQVLFNLLSNAIKFTPEGGQIFLQVDVAAPATNGSNEHKQLVIKVRDTGIGIPEDQVQHIFKRFYQADSAPARQGHGTGIGLALVAELIRLMKGEIRVQSKEHSGTVFMITIPIENNAELVEGAGFWSGYWEKDLSTKEPVAIKQENNAEENVDQPLVLIVEDNTDVVYYLRSCLQAHYRIEVAYDGQSGIDAAKLIVPDLVVSDVMMPVKTGFELCEEVKLDFRTSHIPVVLLTAKADIDSRIAGLKRGADAYLAKPFDRTELLIQLANLLENRRKLQARYAGTEPAPSDIPEVQQEDAFIARFREYVEKHIDNEDMDVQVLCRALSISRAQLYRKINAVTGKSATSLIRAIRLGRAKTLLKNPEYNITQVAYEVGFRYPEYFSRAFSEEFGMTPSQFVNLHRISS